MTTQRLRRASLAAVLIGCAVFVAQPAESTAAPGRVRRAAALWTRPVPGPLVRPFAAPMTRYGPGHRGVDFACAPGSVVAAAGSGVVQFAGSVAGTRHVTIAHAPSMWVTGYSNLATLAVGSGSPVRAGQPIGTCGGSLAAHTRAVVHFSLRIGGEYRDPVQLFTRGRVHLVPFSAVNPDVDRPSPSVLATPRAPLRPPQPAPVGVARTLTRWRQAMADALVQAFAEPFGPAPPGPVH